MALPRRFYLFILGLRPPLLQSARPGKSKTYRASEWQSHGEGVKVVGSAGMMTNPPLLFIRASALHLIFVGFLNLLHFCVQVRAFFTYFVHALFQLFVPGRKC